MARRLRKRVAKRRVGRRPTRSGQRATRAIPPAPQRLHNLPTQLTTFIGREQEIAEVKRLLGTTRSLTLTGAAGCGKTRLALQVAVDLLEQYPDGVRLVELAPLSDSALVPKAVASSLDIPEQPGRSLTETLVTYLRAKIVLLILDNCEHLHSACQKLIETLLRASLTIRVMSSSREMLGGEGEVTYRVPSLRVPDTRQTLAIAQLAEYDAIRLFAERAALVRPDFTLTEQNAPAITQICRRLDGMPLAIEFAAARVRTLSVEQIAARLDDRFRLLTAGTRQTAPRQQTLRATMDWSYDLLSEPERAVLRRLSVFAGGWTLEAAEAVCAGDKVATYEVLNLLTQLADKSLVVVETQRSAARYKMLETVRQYAQERLSEAGETGATRQKHRDWYLEWAIHANRNLRTAEQDIWVERLRTEHDNLRAALEWSMEAGGGEPGLRLASALAWFWYIDGHWNEGRKWLEQALALGGNVRNETLANALMHAAYHARSQGDYERARVFADKGLTISRQTNNKEDIAWFLYNLGVVAVREGDHRRGKALCEESVALGRQFGTKYLLANVLAQLGHIARDSSDYQHATTFYEESLTNAREYGQKYTITYALRNMAVFALHVCDYERAGVLFAEGLALGAASPNWVTEECLVGMAEIACAERQYERAACLFGAGDALREALGVRRSPRIQVRYDERLAVTRGGLGDVAFAKQWAEGRAMTLEQAVEYALASVRSKERAGHPTRDRRPKNDSLTARELQVVRLVSRGFTNRQIARALVLSRRTVDAHLQNILNKLGFDSRSQIAAWATERSLRGHLEPGTVTNNDDPRQVHRDT